MAGRWVRNQALRWMRLEQDVRLEVAARQAVDATWMLYCADPLTGLPDEVLSDAIETDAVCHHLALYEHGGLADYIDLRLDARFLERYPEIGAWPRARMGALRLLDQAGRVAKLEEARDGTVHQVRDLGALAGMPQGSCFLGRLVPVAGWPGLIFDDAPFEVDERALQVVAKRGGAKSRPRWLQALQQGVNQARMPVGFGQIERSRFGSDL